MGIIKMKLILISAVQCAMWNLDECPEDVGNSGSAPGNDCGSFCGGPNCLYEVCCSKGSVRRDYTGNQSCRTLVNSCTGFSSRRVLKEEDDFDSLDDLELSEQDGHFAGQ